MAALGDLANDNQLALLAARATADINAIDARHQLAGILAGLFAALGRCVQQFANQHDIGAFVAVEPKAELADFNEAPGQHMQQKPPEKLAGGHGHDTGAAIHSVVFAGKADLPPNRWIPDDGWIWPRGGCNGLDRRALAQDL